MITTGVKTCPKCGSENNLKYYDKVKRIVRTKGRKSGYIIMNRFKCKNCGTLHREIPHFIYPFKQYESEVIKGVQEELITCDTYGFEDYPTELTMKRWRSRK